MLCKRFSALILALTVFLTSVSKPQGNNWQEIDEGLFLGNFLCDSKSFKSDDTAIIIIIKIDPELYDFTLLCASELSKSLTVLEWSHQFHLIGAINAGMYMADGRTHVGYMKNFQHVNNASIKKEYHSYAAFHPKGDYPSFRIFDGDESSVEAILNNYETVIQNLRLIKRPGENLWKPQERKWCEAALGQDADNFVLWIYTTHLFSMHDFNNALLSLPLSLQCAQHLEGAAPASLYFTHRGVSIIKSGIMDLSDKGNEANNWLIEVPNVLGFMKK
jgi:hypothetical protein